MSAEGCSPAVQRAKISSFARPPAFPGNAASGMGELSHAARQKGGSSHLPLHHVFIFFFPAPQVNSAAPNSNYSGLAGTLGTLMILGDRGPALQPLGCRVHRQEQERHRVPIPAPGCH